MPTGQAVELVDWRECVPPELLGGAPLVRHVEQLGESVKGREGLKAGVCRLAVDVSDESVDLPVSLL